MGFDRFVRRLHLYLALLLSAWFAIYGTSAFFLAHQGFGEQLGRALAGPDYQEYTPRFEVDFPDPIQQGAGRAELRAFSNRVVAAHDLECSHHPRFADPTHISVYCLTFFTAVRLTYDLDSRRLLAEDRHMRLDSTLATFHARAGFKQDSLLSDLWAVMVDVVALSLLVWCASGLWMWWRIPRARRAGTVALVAGFACSLFFVLGH